jgi:hypothetical protein
LQNLILFPDVGRPQKAEGVRKIVTRKYAYLIYYVVDDLADEIVILRPTGSARGMAGIIPERWAASSGFRKNEHAKRIRPQLMTSREPPRHIGKYDVQIDFLKYLSVSIGRVHEFEESLHHRSSPAASRTFGQ